MSELRAYLMGRKTFDPALDTATLVDEFVEGFVACVGHNGVSQYRYGGSVAWLGSIAGKQVTVGPCRRAYLLLLALLAN